MPKDYEPVGKGKVLKQDDMVPAGGLPQDKAGGMSKATVNLPKEQQTSSYYVTRKP
jgi:hypothetical protein